jgi:hypothetical protein
VRADLVALLNEFNGNVDAANLANGAVTVPKLGTIPSAKAYRATAQTIPSGVVTPVAFDNESWDNNGLHDNVTNNTRLTSTATGVYMISATVEWTANATGVRALILRMGGTTAIARDDRLSNGAGVVTIMAIASQNVITAGQYVELAAYQTSGVGLDIIATDILPQFAMTWMSAG